MKWNRNRDALLNGLIGALLGYAIARWRGRENRVRSAVVVGAVFALLNWLTYEKSGEIGEFSGETESTVEDDEDLGDDGEQGSDDERTDG